MEVISGIHAELGEGPVWDDRRQVLYMVDISGKIIYEFNPQNSNVQAYPTEQMVGALVPREQGGLLLAMQQGLYTYDLDMKQTDWIGDPEAGREDNRFNDGKCDPAGRFWAGTLSMVGKKEQAALYRLDTDGTITKMIDAVSCSNGLAWSSDHQTMYYIDTLSERVMAYDFNKTTGDISNGRTVIDFTDQPGLPDGMTIDAEDCLWIAHWGGCQVSRWNPKTGDKLASIELPALNVTSCTFGGKNLDELYITTAYEGMSEEERRQYPKSGCLFKTTPGVTGTPASFYKG
ncbi:SMP-30/gluconolactonase/LRE family protein [Paenibacillus senegalensis]|uniref:SMP-30/gluconolactonase/LRE family protein n=1 Tax=Paenibacillus senegalensis TaxID=1465766 RepID=UPI0002884DAB|nr:SMP-30/gluconolactonase/LRE family protein [Paenibacillus senegalensis]